MRIVQTVVYYLLIFLVRIGDIVIALLSVTISLLQLVITLIQSTGTAMLAFGLRVGKSLGQSVGALRHTIGNISLPKRTSPPRKRRRKKAKPHIRFRYFLYGVVFSALFFFLPIAIFLFLEQLPSPKVLTTRQIPQTTKIYDRNGTLLTEIYGPQDRTLVTLDEIPESLRLATIAIEDKNFYTHPGFDIEAMVRAARENISGRSFQGASTLTQQLVRSSFLTSEPTYVRKIKEVILAFWTERLYTKDDILLMYFNQIPYGGTAWGVEEAAKIYFNKHASDLSLAESAFLAGITAAPTTYSPFGDRPDLWKNRQRDVLSRMIALGFLTEKEAEQALQEELVFTNQPPSIKAPYFVNYLKDYLVRKYGLAMVERGGLSITTSLDMTLQEEAETIVADEVAKSRYLNLTNGAMLITDPTNGDILVMVGGHDFQDPNGGNVNLATAKRQPGSSIKVVTYAQALIDGFSPATIIDDSPVSYAIPGGPTYRPVNYDGGFVGRVPLRYALANSLNIPAVKTLNAIGIEPMVLLAKRMGITSWGDPEQYGLSITLGAAEATMLEMATVYGTLAHDGQRVDPNPILKITDSRGRTIEEKTTPHTSSALPSGVAFIISDILADNQARSMEFGPRSPLYIPGHTVSVKTGTSDNKRDNWTIAYTPNRVVTVWVGNNDNSPMSQSLASGITGAAPIMHQMMLSLLTENPEPTRGIPDDIVTKPCFGRNEYFLVGTENTPCQRWGQNQRISPTLAPQEERST